MKKYLRSLFILFVSFQGVLMAQSVSPDCAMSVAVCKDIISSGVTSGPGVDDFNGAAQSGCLLQGINQSIESNSVWFRFRTVAAGELGFNIIPNNSGEDLDFAVYGPNPDCNNLQDPVGADGTLSNCGISNFAIDFSPNNNGLTGVGVNPQTGTQTVTYTPYMDVEAGEEYLILVNNYTAESEGFRLEFTGAVVDGEQQALDCSIVPDLLEDVAGQSFCEGEVFELDGAYEMAATYRWYVDSTPEDGVDNFVLIPGENQAVYGATATGIYRVEAITASGFAEYDETLVTFEPSNQPTILDVTVEDLSDNNIVQVDVANPEEYTFQLNDGPVTDTGRFEGVPVGLNTVAITHVSGCGSETIEVTVAGFPKFFTPNGDGINDLWNVVGLEDLDDARIFIFDRFGKLLKQISASGNGWDGTYNGRSLPSSDYWFRLEYTDSQSRPQVVKSNFSLKR
ncbi:T9SS type B sorting domain-containing protein [Robertkochia aurantiaca]|uniref:T9SS type B sorting domain-containing protein n=1 Tax=Robertkochia aurantiaca TaxID=2873700 RepID=UPI001CCEEFAE|nr:T9SS type B sorting domain-containing protein [Robertkochia sp. 3YJGBD-33]